MDEDKVEFAFEKVKEALNGENPLAEKFGTYDNPAFIDHLADNVAYRSTKTDEVEEIGEEEARQLIQRLVAQDRLRRISNNMWIDDMVTLA